MTDYQIKLILYMLILQSCHYPSATVDVNILGDLSNTYMHNACIYKRNSNKLRQVHKPFLTERFYSL